MNAITAASEARRHGLGGGSQARSPTGAHGHASTEPDADARATVSVGMAVALGALTMTFAAVLLAYAIVRTQSSSWPPPGESRPPSIWPWPIAATLAALAGSVALSFARRSSAAGLQPSVRVTRALACATAAGIAFMGIQTTAWIWLTRAGVHPASGIVASVVYALTLFHALHALAAIVALMPLLIRAARGRPVRGSALAAVSSFWHLVTVAWIVVFLAVFLV